MFSIDALYYLGVDPGFTGALVVVESHSAEPFPRIHSVFDMPCLVADSSKPSLFGKAHSKQVVNACELASMLRPFVDRLGERFKFATIEKVSAAPDQGVSSMFRFGEGFGVVQGVMAALGVKMHFVSPSVWKTNFNLSREKQTSLDKAKSVFGTEAHDRFFTRKKDHGRAEAALLAYYGKLYF